MTEKQASLTDSIMHMLNEGYKREEIITTLLARGHDERYASEMLHETAKLRSNRLRTQGLALILAGAVICLLSCVLTITTSSLNGSFPYVLYGLTTLGILVVFAGFVKVF